LAAASWQNKIDYLFNKFSDAVTVDSFSRHGKYGTGNAVRKQNERRKTFAS